MQIIKKHSLIFFSFFIGGGLLFFTGCETTLKSSVKIDKKGWAIDKNYTLNFTANDTLKKDLIIELHHDDNYPFENIFLITHLQFPNGKKVTDTLEYIFSDIEGKWLGNGWGKEKKIALYYKEKIPLKKGNHHLKIRQAMRKRNDVKGVQFLKGIHSIGIRLENN